MPEEMQFVAESGERYPSWEALVEDQANGWVATAILRERAPRGSLFTWTVGPFPTKREAVNAGNRIRSKHRREDAGGHAGSDLVAVTAKPAWKGI